MIIAITGTPGTGKTSVAKKLFIDGYNIIDLKKIAFENNFLLGTDKKRKTEIIDIKKLDRFILKNYMKKEIFFAEGHISHLLKSIDKIILLRRNPEKLRKNLENRDWNKEKINENIESEILDIILCEAVEIQKSENIFEIDTTDKTINDVVSIIKDLLKKEFKNIKKYKIGKIDWSEDILKDF